MKVELPLLLLQARIRELDHGRHEPGLLGLAHIPLANSRVHQDLYSEHDLSVKTKLKELPVGNEECLQRDF